MTDCFELRGKRILITGASSGIGRACAIAASQAGASLVLTGRRMTELEHTKSLCRGEDHRLVSGDVALPEFVGELAERCGKLDGLVHAAGIGPMCPVWLLEREQAEAVMRVNYFAFLELMKYFSKRKYRNDRFSVVAVSSVAAFAGWSGVSAYCGSKGALSAGVRALAMELAPKGIRVNAVCPSNIKTPMYESGASELNDEAALNELLKKQPLGLGMPEDVAWPVCFLLSDAARFVTGINLPVDGGYLAQ